MSKFVVEFKVGDLVQLTPHFAEAQRNGQYVDTPPGPVVVQAFSMDYGPPGAILIGKDVNNIDMWRWSNHYGLVGGPW